MRLTDGRLGAAYKGQILRSRGVPYNWSLLYYLPSLDEDVVLSHSEVEKMGLFLGV